MPENVFQNLRTLDLSHNDINKWSDFKYINHLPKLVVLLFGYNPLDDLKDDDLPVFPNIEVVNCHSTNISDFSTVQNLVKAFPKMRTLRLQETPLTQKLGLDVSRIELISRIKSLTRLNGSDVRTKQRIDSERYYLQRCIADIMEKNNFTNYSQWVESKPEFKEEIIKNYPRYNELVELHGEPIPSSAQKSSIKELSKIDVYFESHAASSCTSAKTKKTLPLSMKVKNVMDYVKRLYKIDIDKQRLYYKNPDETFLVYNTIF